MYYFFLQMNILFNSTIDVVISSCVFLEINSWCRKNVPWFVSNSVNADPDAPYN